MSGAELGIAVGGGILTEIGNLFYKCIGQKIGRVFKHQSYMEDMDNQLLLLRNRKEREERRIEHAVRQGDEIHEDVTQWLTDVNLLIELVENPTTGLRVQGQTNTRCFKGICPNFMTRYKLSKQAEKAAKDTTMLMERNFSVVSYPSGLQRTASMFVRDYEGFDSRESVLQGIMEALRDAKINMIGVYGLGGVGKTTIVKKVAWQVIQDKLFDDVVVVDVSQKPDHKKIQEKIASDLGMEFGLHETEFKRAFRLRNRLKKGKRVLVILDNIWTKPNLEDIGIPLPDEQKGSTLQNEECQGVHKDEQRIYKILLTSRRLDLLRNDMSTQQNFLLETLSDGEAQNLFWKIVGYSAAERGVFQAIAEEIVGKCGGLPLAVATIASALKNRSLHHWKDALDKLRTSNQISIPEMDEKVFKVIKLSFDFLQSDEAKSLLLLCTLVGSEGTSCDYLLRYGTGLGLFQDVYTLEMGRNRVNMLIDNLKASCLLVEGYSNNWVKMHDIVHAVAVSIASTSKLMFSIRAVPDVHTALKEKISKNPTAISLPYADINDLNQLPAERLECPKLELFFLFLESPSSQIPNDFFEGMKELRVIDISYVNLLHLPSSLYYLKNLQTLCLDGCLLGDIATIGELKNLQILSFSRSNIEKLPGEIGQLTSLKLLDLSGCSNLKLIPPNVISRLSYLEELCMDNSFVQWEVGGLTNQDYRRNASLAELNQLSCLTNLNIQILDAQIIPNDFFFQKLQRYRILIGDVWNWSHTNEASRTLKLKLNNSSSYLGWYAISTLLKITEDLYLDELNGIQNVLYELDGEGLSNLKHLYVQNNAELLYIVNLEGRISCMNAAFHLLESLVLDNLIKLEKISHGKLNKESFNKLRLVKVNKCHGLKHLFSISMVKSLLLLQEIQVTDCKNLRAVFTEEDGDDENDRNNEIVLTQLCSLTLQGLPQFTSFSFSMKTPQTLFNTRVDFPNLKKLKLSSVGNTGKISPEQLSSPMAFYCQNVEILTLEGLDDLKFLFSSSAIKSFAQLQHLELCNCKSMERIIDTTGIIEAEESMSFPKLVLLKIKDLPKLTRFANTNTVDFPSLTLLHIENCPNLRTFSSSHTVLSDEPDEEMISESEEINTRTLFGDKVGLPCLEELMVTQMDNLRKLWDNQLRLDSFCKMKVLKITECNQLSYILPSSIIGRLERLEILEVQLCESVEEIFEPQALSVSGRKTTPIALAATQLRFLHLCNLPSLRHVWDMDAQEILAFENLTSIRICNCKGLKALVPASLAKSGLLKLEQLAIRTSSLEEIVAIGKEEEAVTVIPRFKFPQLTSLTLFCLPQLKTFYPKPHISEWPALKKMKVSGCDNASCVKIKILSSEFQHQLDEDLQPFFLVEKVGFPQLEELQLSYLSELQQLWPEDSQPSGVFRNLATVQLSECARLKTLVPSAVSLWNLKTLQVSNCAKLISLVTLTTAKTLVNIATMDISKCPMMEEIIAHMEDGANDDQITFKQLNYLRLVQLPSLKSFCLGNYHIVFPSLEQAIVGKCPEMVMKILNILKLHIGHLQEGSCQDNPNTVSQQFNQELVGLLGGSKYVRVSKFPQLKEIWHDQLLLPVSLFSDVGSLVVDECANIPSAISANLLQCLNNLELLEVRDCDSLEQVFDFEELSSVGGLLSKLSEFYLINLPSLRHLWRRRTSHHQEILSFRNLKFVEVENCSSLRYLFSWSMISSLDQLEEMKIRDCARMEVIIREEEDIAVDHKIVLPQLNSIILESLPESMSFYWGSNILECPSLKSICITNCAKMETFVFSDKMKDLTDPTFFTDKVFMPALERLTLSSIATENIRPNKFLATSRFENLEVLLIDGCNNLRYLLPSCTSEILVQLMIVDIRNCLNMEGIILTEEERMSRQIFPKLGYLWLENLPKLKMFCNSTGNLVYLSSLIDLEIINCPNMKAFTSNSVSANETTSEGSEENLQADIQPLFDEKVELSNLKDLRVYNMDNLRKIWDDQLTSNSFSKLENLCVRNCGKLENIFPPIMYWRLQRLGTLMVQKCDSLEEIFEIVANENVMVESVTRFVFPQLTSLRLEELPQLKTFCSGKHFSEWPVLEKLKVYDCVHVKILASEFRSFLEESQQETAVEQPLFLVDEAAFPNLRELELSKLTDLLYLWKENSQASCQGFQNLATLKVTECDKLTKLVPSTVTFPNLMTLEVSKCDGLTSFITSPTLKSLVQLTTVNITDCKIIGEIITQLEDEQVNDDILAMNELKYLELDCLPNLKTFCLENCTSEFASLEKVLVRECPNR